eukprot:2729824-Prymnesium_polylepis.2
MSWSSPSSLRSLHTRDHSGGLMTKYGDSWSISPSKVRWVTWRYSRSRIAMSLKLLLSGSSSSSPSASTLTSECWVEMRRSPPASSPNDWSWAAGSFGVDEREGVRGLFGKAALGGDLLRNRPDSKHDESAHDVGHLITEYQRPRGCGFVLFHEFS